MALSPKAWTNSLSTPLDAAALIDLETRLGAYTDEQVAAAAEGVADDDARLSNQRAPTDASVTVAKLAGALEAVLKGAAVHDGTNYPARPPFGSVEWIGPTDPGGLAEDGDTWVATS